MSEWFKVGEIAEVAVTSPDGKQNKHGFSIGDEVTVIEPLADRIMHCGDCMACYIIERDGKRFHALPHWLRKRRPPQDWMKLCNLHDIPREVAHV